LVPDGDLAAPEAIAGADSITWNLWRWTAEGKVSG
jgi:hypothetical protein